MKKKFIYILVLLIYFINAYYVYYHREVIHKQDTLFLDKNWILSYNKEILYTNLDIPIYKSGKNPNSFPKGIYTYETTFDYKQEFDEAYIVFPYALNQAYELYINDILIGKRGDLKQGRSNLWYSPIKEIIPKKHLKEENKLILKTYSSYESGLTITPYIKDKYNNIFSIFLLDTFFIYLPYGQSGILFALIIVFVLMSIKNNDMRKFNLYYTLSLLFLFLYSLDSQTIELLPIRYIYFKKATLTSFFLSILFSCLSLRELDTSKKKNRSLYIIIPLSLMCLLLIFSPFEETIFRSIYSQGAYVVIPYLIYCFYVVKNNRNNTYLARLSWGLIALTLVALHDSITLNIDEMSIVLFNHSIFIYSFYATGIFLGEVLYYHEELEKEKSKVQLYYNLSRIDNLTKAFNRKRLDELEQELEGEYTVIYFDMDKFKDINDTYGHFAGDKALIEFAQLIFNKLGKGTDLIRIGGDEFVLVLQLEDNILDDFIAYMVDASRGIEFEFEEKLITLEFSIGFSSSNNKKDLYDIINNADRLLYVDKNS